MTLNPRFSSDCQFQKHSCRLHVNVSVHGLLWKAFGSGVLLRTQVDLGPSLPEDAQAKFRI